MFLLAPSEAYATCLLLAVSFVGGFYLAPARVQALPRDNPVHVRFRFAVIAVVCTAAPFVTGFWWDGGADARPAGAGAAPGFWAWLGFRVPGFGYACVLPLALTTMLFAGPLAVAFLERRALRARFGGNAPWVGYAFPNSRPDAPLLALRNLVVGPFSEELVFRSCMLPLVLGSGTGRLVAIFTTPLFFSFAHLHHAVGMVRSGRASLRDAAMSVLFQVAYTTVFGAYAAFVLARTGHFVAVFLLHAFCNCMGFPSVGWTFPHHRLYPRRFEISVAFVTGMVLFSVCVVPMTAPNIYSNDALMWGHL